MKIIVFIPRDDTFANAFARCKQAFSTISSNIDLHVASNFNLRKVIATHYTVVNKHTDLPAHDDRHSHSSERSGISVELDLNT